MKKTYSILSGAFSVMAIFPILAGLTKWGFPLYVAVLEVSLFLPFTLAFAGLVFALMGLKGKWKISLVVMNAAGLSLSLFLVFVALFGFQQP
ncbi:hypothetical protein Q0N12_09890 [Rossellomorea marisflavi]|uniref:hypothetical protein n=1 Tax=Rossellomorea marisflavi TaxID=189381 RepID=UPI00345AA20A